MLLLRRAALADVGTFDERFFLYSEDEDWQRRAVDARAGRCASAPTWRQNTAPAGPRATADRLQLRLHAAIERYIRKWYGTMGWELYRAGTLFGLVLRLARRGAGRRRRTARLARLYLTGPDRAARRTGAVPAR